MTNPTEIRDTTARLISKALTGGYPVKPKLIDYAAADAAIAFVIEQAAQVADQLGGDRVDRGKVYADDKHGRSDMLINAQHVRAQSIASAIRLLADRGKS